MDTTFTRRRALELAGVGALGTVAAGAPESAPADRHIVGTASKRGTEEARRRAESVHRVLEFGAAGEAVAGQFPETALRALRNNPRVRYVEPDATYAAVGETLPWGVDRIDADRVHADGQTGGDGDDGEGGADVAILDTGIDDDHPDLAANVGAGAAYVACEGSNCNYAWSDDHGHGTYCAGVAAAEDDDEGVIGVSPGATLHAVKVLASDGVGYWSDIAAGIEWVADQGYEVANMSLAGSSGSSTVRDACQYAYERGVLLVAAAGNDGPCSDCVGYPAAFDTVVAVSATSSDDSLAEFSSTGPEIELAAPGESVTTTAIDGYVAASGTSMACPHVGGAGAQLMDDGYTNGEARRRLRETAEDIGLSSAAQGSGLVDVEAAMDDGAESSVSVTTGSATSSETSATLSGSLDDLGGLDAVDCSFEYRESGASEWVATGAQTLSTTGGFETTITDLTDGIEYEYRAVATTVDGDGDTGGVETVVTSENLVAVSTGSATSAETSATLSGSLDDLGNADAADCSFEYRESGTSAWTATSAQTLSSTGAFEATVSGLSEGVEYEYRAVADASDGDGDTGSVETVATSGSAVVVTTGSATSEETSATLTGSLDDLGGADSVDCSLDYRESGANEWTATSTQTLSSTGSFETTVTGLTDGVEYEYRAVASASDGDGDAGSVETVVTSENLVAVSTGSAGDVGDTAATLSGSLDDLGNADAADCSFEYRESGTSAWTLTGVQTLSSTGTYSEEVADLSSNTDYEFRAVAAASDGDADAGSTSAFATTGTTGTTEPSVDSYAVTEAGSPNPHAEITAEWTVGDVDGDLDGVVVEVIDGSGSTADSARHDVSGSSASGSDEFQIKHARKESFDVVLTVTDSGGRSASETRTVTE